MIRKVLDCSTAHLRPMTRDSLWDGCLDAIVYKEGTSDPAAVFVHVAPEGSPRIKSWPDDLTVVIDRARNIGCDFVLFDRDGTIHANLPRWED